MVFIINIVCYLLVSVKRKTIILFTISFFALSVTQVIAAGNWEVVPHDQPYYTKDVRNVELIYTEKNQDTAQRAADVQMLLQPVYEDVFGYTLDEKLYIGLASDYNQIPNGFASFLPYARQVYYNGGALLPDHFSDTSWLDSLLYHETAHSYQLNAKDNIVSSTLHSVLKNGNFILPWLVNPNVVESSFMLEGNAVLNEAWHGNGGRLYSGRFKIATLMQAKAGLLTPERVYNNNLFFLYGSHNYTLGSHYQYFLAENYGLKKTNSYWLMRSKYWLWPFYTNQPTKQVFGKDFETLIAEWSEKMQGQAKAVIEAEGELLAESQFYYAINDDAAEVYFIVNKSGREYPDLVILDKSSQQAEIEVTTHAVGKVVKTLDGEYATQTGAFINPWRQYIGLYDDSVFPVDGTESKVVEGYLDNGKQVYFDVTQSYAKLPLYISDEYYTKVNSSVYIQGNDVYYFKQKNKDRTLYKNKKALYTFKGHYGHPIGANNTGVYFIANTEYGSGLYRYAEGRIQLMNPADTIFDARLLDEDTALVVSMGSEQYKYMLVKLAAQEQSGAQQPYEVSLFMEHEPYFEQANPDKNPPQVVPETDLENSYSSMLNMHYSGTDFAIGKDSEAGLVYNLRMNFADPLSMNSLSLFAGRNLDEYGLAGISYDNAQYFLNYRFTAYGVYERPDKPPGIVLQDERDYGLIANADILFLRTGYYYGSLGASYFEDYSSNSRKPLGASLTLGNAKQFGVSMDRNFVLQATGYSVEDRGDNAYGGKGIYKQGLPAEFFVSVQGQYSSSDSNTGASERGIKIAASQLAMLIDSDLSTIVMPGIKNNPSYAKEVSKIGGEIKKVFNFHAYYFTFPVSLRRQAFFIAYNRYQITGFNSNTSKVNEMSIGVDLDTFWLNRLPIPVRMEYVYTDDDVIANTDIFRVQLGFQF